MFLQPSLPVAAAIGSEAAELVQFKLLQRPQTRGPLVVVFVVGIVVVAIFGVPQSPVLVHSADLGAAFVVAISTRIGGFPVGGVFTLLGGILAFVPRLKFGLECFHLGKDIRFPHVCG